MNVSTVLSMARSGRLVDLRSLTSLMADTTRATFLAAARREGILEALRRGPMTLDDLRAVAGIAEGSEEAFRAWLEIGLRVDELEKTGRKWALRGRLARALSDPKNDDLAAMLEELVTLHHRLVLEAPSLLRSGRRLTLADQVGEVVARSSRVLEPLVEDALRPVVPTRGTFRLLDAGCGSGTYSRFVANRNPDAAVVALELQAEVVERARQNFVHWGVSHRVSTHHGDLRTYSAQTPFDLVTLHNNIYYFSDRERIGLFEHIRNLLVPGGRLLLTTACPGGSASVAVLHLWGMLTEGAGPLPEPEHLVAQLAAAGFVEPSAQNLAAPLDRFYAFTARRPQAD